MHTRLGTVHDVVLIGEEAQVSKRVLVIDDSDTVRREMTQLLQQAGFATLEACDGPSGLTLAREPNISLILLDVNLPGMNGLEILEHLRMDWVTASVPVIILTTEAEALKVQRARKAGAKGWLIKPVAAANLLRLAQTLAQSEPARRRQSV